MRRSADESFSSLARRRWPAMVIDTSTTSGAATLSGMKKASSGTATSASPKPNADRISVAINKIE
jgi:hypothetical protein